MMEHKPSESTRTRRARNMVVIVFAVLGVVVPIALYPFVSYTHPLQRSNTYNSLERFLWSVVPYLWPSAPIVSVPEGDIRDVIVLWVISLLLNAAIYSVAGFGLWHLARLVAKLRTRSLAA
jgi:hypothetical protein